MAAISKKKIKLLSRHTENSFHPLISPPRSPLDRRQPSSSSSNEEISRNNVTGNVGENRSVRSCFLFFFVQYLACICIDYNRAKRYGRDRYLVEFEFQARTRRQIQFLTSHVVHPLLSSLPRLNNVAAPADPPSAININGRCPVDLSIAVADYAGRSLGERSLGLVEGGKREEREKTRSEIEW